MVNSAFPSTWMETKSRSEEANERFEELKKGDGLHHMRFLCGFHQGRKKSMVREVMFLSALPGAQHQARTKMRGPLGPRIRLHDVQKRLGPDLLRMRCLCCDSTLLPA